MPLHAAQQIESAAAHHRVDDRREAATGMEVEIVASTQEPPASITTGAAGHCRLDDTLIRSDVICENVLQVESHLESYDRQDGA